MNFKQIVKNSENDKIEISNDQIASFNDPLALKIEWTPLVNGGANFQTCKIVEIENKRLEVVPSTISKIFLNIFSLIGIGLMSLGIYFVYEEKNFSDPKIILFVMGLAFSIATFLMRRILLTKKVFDKISGYFWKGSRDVRAVYNVQEDSNYRHLNEIKAIQIISEIVYTDKTRYVSYELNLVFKDTTRINIADNIKIKAIREHASKLSDFLDVPVWDGTKVSDLVH